MQITNRRFAAHKSNGSTLAVASAAAVRWWRSVRFLSGFAVGATLLLMVGIMPCHANDPDVGSQVAPSSTSAVDNYFSDWFARVSKTQAEQPHWITPVATVTPRLEQELRYDQMWESLPNGKTLTSYGGGKGLELTLAAGYQIAATTNPLYQHNFILSARLPF